VSDGCLLLLLLLLVLLVVLLTLLSRSRGTVVEGNLRCAALAIRPAAPTALVLGCLYEIPLSEMAPYLRREARYRALRVACEELGGEETEAWTVVEQTDEVRRWCWCCRWCWC